MYASGTEVEDDRETLEDRLYTVQTKGVALLVEYGAPKELFYTEIDKFSLLVEALIINE